MAYIAAFDHEVFLSYAHIDNVVDGEDRWVSVFQKQLSARLLKLVGESVKVWADSELDRAQVFDDVIRTAVERSAIMVCLVSPSYLKSRYCGQELDCFTRHGQVTTETSHRRVFPVLLNRLPFADWPSACQGTSGFEFFDPDQPRESRPLDIKGTAFSNRLWDLASEVKVVLDVLRRTPASVQGAPVANGAPTSDGPAPFRVFLGLVADDLRKDRNYLQRELEQRGIEVLKQVPPPYEPDQHANAVGAALERADLAVHLLGRFPGAEIDGAPGDTYDVAQTRQALDATRPQLVLMPESLAPETIDDEGYKGFVQALEGRPRATGALQVIKGTRAQWLDAVVGAKQRRDEIARLARPNPNTPPTAFVDHHLKDLSHIADLLRYLGERDIPVVTVPSAGRTPMTLFESALRAAQLFVVVYGGVDPAWVRQRLEHGTKFLASNGLATPVGVYVAPPDKSIQAVNFQPYDVMLNTAAFDPATIEPLLARASRGTGA